MPIRHYNGYVGYVSYTGNKTSIGTSNTIEVKVNKTDEIDNNKTSMMFYPNRYQHYSTNFSNKFSKLNRLQPTFNNLQNILSAQDFTITFSRLLVYRYESILTPYISRSIQNITGVILAMKFLEDSANISFRAVSHYTGIKREDIMRYEIIFLRLIEYRIMPIYNTLINCDSIQVT